MIVALDTGPLGLLTNPRANDDSAECVRWLTSILDAGNRVVVPEICDYELRRELMRGDKTAGLLRLDELEEALEYVALDTATMRLACAFWARLRKEGRATADDKALDGDVILAAQVQLLGQRSGPVRIATTNVKHLALLADAEEWTAPVWA